ncbi:MAG: class I SAM-dependent RNA methyltransferase [Elusimicrobia bacterium]|nr:class I SAM-dependent RNA methyltransferase [Elusimicrobiota bacterium]
MERLLALCGPGLEALATAELAGQPGVVPAPRTVQGSGRVAFLGGFPAVYRANLRLRCSERVLVLLSEFRASGFESLCRKAEKLAWERFLMPGQPVAFKAECLKSRLYHESAVVERLAGSIGARLGRVSPVKKLDEEGSGAPPQLFVVRIEDDLASVWVDSSGEPLHRRGYRLETAKAPLRETLASAMVLASGWDKTSPFIDPFCGSGTVAIEAALLARAAAPGSSRRFAFMGWPCFDARAWGAALVEARKERSSACPRILASDRDAGAVEAARANARRAGVEADIAFSTLPVSAVEPVPGPGWIVTNPPYGVRLGRAKDLRDLYAAFGSALWRKFPGWKAGVLCGSADLMAATGLKFKPELSTMNGGLTVAFYCRRI